VKDLDKKMIEFDILQNNLKMIKEREEVIAKKLEELTLTKVAIEELEHTKLGETFIPIGSGNFIEGNISKIDNIIVGVGSGIAIKKKRNDAINILDRRVEEMENALKELSIQGQEIFNQLRNTQEEIEKLRK